MASPSPEGSIESLKSEVENRCPSVLEIAHIAALLTIGRKSDSSLAQTVAKEAIQLWDQCEIERANRIEYLALQKYGAAQSPVLSFPMPEKFPIPFKECLCLLMPNKKRLEDREKIYRDYVRDSARVSKYMEQGNWSGKAYEDTPIPSDVEIANIISKWRSEGFSEESFNNTKQFFGRWFPDYESKKLSERARKGATAKWKGKPEDGQTA